MRIFDVLKDNLSQILAITEKNVKFRIRWKFNLIVSYITPLITLIMPIIIMGEFFKFNENYGPWTRENFLVYQFIAYNINLLRSIMTEYPSHFQREKYWETLPALIIAPFNRFNLLFGIFFAHSITIFIPFTIFFILCYIYYPVSIFTALFVIFLFFCVSLSFSGIGLIIGIFAISKEKYLGVIDFSIVIFFWFACISFPFEIFPPTLQSLISLNPLYYIFDIIRLAWIEDDAIYTIISHPFSFFLLITCAITIPCVGVVIFNKIYRKYGIVGY